MKIDEIIDESINIFKCNYPSLKISNLSLPLELFDLFYCEKHLTNQVKSWNVISFNHKGIEISKNTGLRIKASGFKLESISINPIRSNKSIIGLSNESI